MFLSKVGVLNWYSSMKFFLERKMILKVRNLQFCNSISFVWKSPKSFQCNFCDSTIISVIVISFHQIPLTWWNAYTGDSPTSLVSQTTNSTSNSSLCKTEFKLPLTGMMKPPNPHMDHIFGLRQQLLSAASSAASMAASVAASGSPAVSPQRLF